MQYLSAWPSHELVGYRIDRALHVSILLVLHCNQQHSEVGAAQVERQETTTLWQPTPDPTFRQDM